MKTKDYSNLIINHQYQELANINNINDLVTIKYNNRFLIEYLLEQGIHNEQMDNLVRVSDLWISFYIKYGIYKPLLMCHPSVLLKRKNDTLILDNLLSKLSNEEARELLHNIKKIGYWEYHEHEKEIVDLYQKYQITIPEIFISNKTLNETDNLPKRREIIRKFNEAYADLDSIVLRALNNELNYSLKYNYRDTYKEIEKVIDYKKNHPEFIIKFSNDTEGSYDNTVEELYLSPYRRGVLFHEISHLIYHEYESNDVNVIDEYEKMCSNINEPETLQNIISYLNSFHQRFFDMKKYFVILYNQKLIKKHQSREIYIKVIRDDLINNDVDLIDIQEKNLYLYLNNDNMDDLINELIDIEEEEYVNRELRSYYSEELLLENLLDAILKGKIIEGKLGIEGLSVHCNIDFMRERSLSFNECLADYSSLKKSMKGNRLIQKLRELIGDEFVDYLDNYIELNRFSKRR